MLLWITVEGIISW